MEQRHGFVDSAFTAMAQRDGVTFVPVWDLMCPKYCLITAENRALYSDRTHISLYGAKRFLGAALKPRFYSSGIVAKDD
jgi:hypothetical protein